MNRAYNAKRNFYWGIFSKSINILITFIIRTMIIHTLGIEYTGLHSFFTSVLQVLNIAEMGVSSAITFSLYKPIAVDDKIKVCALMNLYKRIYRIIGIIIITIGLILLPFLHFFVSGEIPNDINIYILYLIYLLNTGLSYFLFAYKSALLEANQRNDIISKINSILLFVQSLYQMIIILYFKNYYLYIIIQPIITITCNVTNKIITEKLYPDIICQGEISSDDKRNIRKKVYGLMIQKICTVTRNSCDSIFLSSFLGLSVVAIYNNYFMVTSAITSIISVVGFAILASIGNSIVTENQEKNFNDMRVINFAYMWISGWAMICLICLFQPFMSIWVGKEYLFSNITMLLLCIYFYMLKMGDIMSTYIQANGLFWEGKYRALVEAILNIILNYILGKKYGVNGIIVATMISLFFVNFLVSAYILFKYYFTKYKSYKYILEHLWYLCNTIIALSITYFITNSIHINGIINIFIIGFICLIIPNIVLFLIYMNTSIFYESLYFFRSKILKYKK